MLNAKDQNILELLLSGLSISEVARRSGVTRQTVHNRLKDDAFMRAYETEIEERRKLARINHASIMEAAYEAVEWTLKHPLGVRTSELLKAAEIALHRLK